MKLWANKQKGFTIVELLIVIVIVAILAAITIVAYNGIQQRAYSSRAVSVANSYIKLLNMYYADHGEYPTFDDTPSGYACLGPVESFPATGSMAAGECHTYGGFIPSAQLNTALGQYTSKLPDGSLPAVEIDGGVFRGMVYGYGAITYPLGPGGTCPVGEQIPLNPGGNVGCIIDLSYE